MPERSKLWEWLMTWKCQVPLPRDAGREAVDAIAAGRCHGRVSARIAMVNVFEVLDRADAVETVMVRGVPYTVAVIDARKLRHVIAFPSVDNGFILPNIRLAIHVMCSKGGGGDE